MLQTFDLVGIHQSNRVMILIRDEIFKVMSNQAVITFQGSL